MKLSTWHQAHEAAYYSMAEAEHRLRYTCQYPQPGEGARIDREVEKYHRRVRQRQAFSNKMQREIAEMETAQECAKRNILKIWKSV